MKKSLILIILITLASSNLFAQSGIKFLDFSKRLEHYFDESMINDIRDQLPQTDDYSIWGYDVGDFSNDSYNDVALTLRIAGDKSRNMQVYLFVDIDGYLRKVYQETIPFVEVPLEVGAAIRNSKCYITKKNKQYNWDIYGYTYQNGSLILYDEFFTRKLDNTTYEKYRDYNDLNGSEKYISLKNNKIIFERNFKILPSYERGRRIYKGIADEVIIDNVDYIQQGAYWWQGKEDCSFGITSAYDEEYLYFTINVEDQSLVVQNCDTCIADYAELIVDINQYGENRRFIDSSEKKTKFREPSKNGIFKFKIYPGDYINLPPYCKTYTNDTLEGERLYESNNIKVVSNKNENSYFMKFKIPWNLLSVKPEQINKELELGLTAVVYDYDNEFRPEEFTRLSTTDFKEDDSTTFGILKIIPDKEIYGRYINIFLEDIVRNLLLNGF